MASFPFGLSLSKPFCKTLVLAPFDRLRANGIGAWLRANGIGDRLRANGIGA
jgi:hypothetical protein